MRLNVVPFSSLRFPPCKDSTELPSTEALLDCEIWMPPNERPTPVVVFPTTLVVESTVEPTADVVPPTTLPTVEVVELTAPPTPPSRPLLLDDERAELVEPGDPLAMVSLPNGSSLLALTLALPLVTEVIVAAIGVCNDPCSSRSNRMPMRDSPLLLLFWTTSVTWPTSREPFPTTVRSPDLMSCVVFNIT